MTATDNKELLDPDKNRKYYSTSDGNFMPLGMAIQAHLHINRVDWAKKKIHEIGSKAHCDIGSKDCYLALTLAQFDILTECVEPSKDAIENGRKKAKKAKVIDHISFVNKFLQDYEPSMSFDSVTAMEVIEHVPDVQEFWEKIIKIAPNVLISTPYIYGEWGMEDSKKNKEHVRLYSAKELESEARNYGEVVECYQDAGQVYLHLKVKQ